jgi:RNA polymerase sigma-70 factor (ECF subfamily)
MAMERVGERVAGERDRRSPSRLPNGLERELVDRVRAGARDSSSQADGAAAFGELYDFYLPRIYGFIYRRVEDRSVAEDLTATVFERALAQLRRGRFRNETFGGWLYRVAANAVVDQARATRRVLPLVPGRVDDPSPDAAGAFAAALDRDELQRAFGRLREGHRRVLALRFFDDLDPDEAAAVLGCSRGTFAVKLHRALAALRGALAKEATDAA